MKYRGANKMIKNYYSMALVMAAIFVGSGVYANDVYIEQAGDTGTFNITQAGSGNRVGTSSSVSTFSGNSIAVDITQTGLNNTADLTVNSGLGTTINYSATGDTNDLQVDINTAGTTLTVNKTGDTNRVTVCGTNDAATALANAVSCTAGVSGADTTNTINITGNTNNVNLALGAPNATNSITIGNNTPSNGNTVNVTQSGIGTHNTGVTVNGDTNIVKINQQ